MKYRDKVIFATLVSVLFSFFPAAEAATPVVKAKVLSVTVVGKAATVKWSAPKLPKGAYFEVEFSSVFPVSFTRILRSATTSISNTLTPYTKYKVRVKSKAIAKGAWSNSKEFITSGDPVNNVNIVKTTHTSVEIAWEEDVAATGYDVTFNNGIPKRTKTPNITFTGLKPGVVGQFSIQPISGIYKGEATPAFEFSTLTSGPTLLKASAITTNSFLLEWVGVEGATSYNVYKNDVFLASSKLTSYAVKSLLPDVAADYWVEAVFTDVVTEASEKLNVKTEQEIIAVPGAPAVSGITSVAANVNWTLDPKASSYTVTLYDALGLTEVATKTISGSITSTQFTSLAPLTGYSVGVVNVRGTNSSKESPLAVFTTLKSELSGLVTSNITTTAITLGWASIPAATSYEVLKDGLVIASSLAPTTLSYGFSSLAPGVTYKLGVRATYLNGAGVTTTTELKEILIATLIDTSFKPAINTNPVITIPVSLNPIVGSVLTATSGVWTATPAVSAYVYQWQRSSDGTGTVWYDIVGENSLSYTVKDTFPGFLLRIKITATNSNGTGTVFSAATTPIQLGYNVTAPQIKGNFTVGQTLEATDGTWFTPYTYVLGFQWLRASTSTGSAVAIAGANSTTYKLVDADIGQYITVQVTASTLQGSLTVVSPTRGVGVAVNNTVAPSISGTVKVGNTLTVATGTWVNATTITQQWQSSSDSASWNAITGATATTYVLTSAESGLYIRAQVFGNYTTGSAVAYKTTALTAVTTQVAASTAGSIATNSVLPVVTGAWSQGTTLSTTTGTWSSTGTFTYQWQSMASPFTAWVNIASATSSTYALTATETNKYVRVQVTNTNSSGAGVASSSPRSLVDSPYNTALPTISSGSGGLRIGTTQTVTTGTWSSGSTLTYSYQWQSSSDAIAWSNIASATSATYAPTFDIANLQLRVSCTATNGIGSATVTTASIQGFLPPQPTAIPTIYDTSTVGSVITITSPGTWPGISSVLTSGYVFQWQKSTDGGNSWANISGATSTTYTISSADLGSKIRLQVTLSTSTGSISEFSLPSSAISP